VTGKTIEKETGYAKVAASVLVTTKRYYE